MEDGEFYLDKFVDLRLKLEAEKESLSKAVETIALELPLAIPFGGHEEFRVERAARLAGKLAPNIGLSMRQIKRSLDRVELACRIYKNRPIDASLLVWLAFDEVARGDLEVSLLPRVQFSRPFQIVKDREGNIDAIYPFENRRKVNRIEAFSVRYSTQDIANIDEFPEIEFLTPVLFALFQSHGTIWFSDVYEHLAPHYIPDHQAMLDAVHKLQADP